MRWQAAASEVLAAWCGEGRTFGVRDLVNALRASGYPARSAAAGPYLAGFIQDLPYTSSTITPDEGGVALTVFHPAAEPAPTSYTLAPIAAVLPRGKKPRRRSPARMMEGLL